MQKILIVVLSILSAVYAETPSSSVTNNNYYPSNLYRAAPYIESGWRPSGPEFRLPTTQTGVFEYLQPPPQYGPPVLAYGPPTTTEEPAATTTTEAPATTTDADQDVEQVTVENEIGGDESAKLSEAGGGATTSQGIYYILHPSGSLQRVMYVRKADQKNMAYTTQLQYRNVEPIREPIFTYDPKTLEFQKLQG